MKQLPIAKMLLKLTIPLLLSNSLHAEELFGELQFLGNDRYIQSEFEEFSDFNTPRYESVGIPRKTFTFSHSLRKSLHQTAKYLQTQNQNLTVARRGANLSNRTLSQTLNTLIRWNGSLTPNTLQQQFDLMPLVNGTNQNSKFTGYYTPTIQASATPNANFSYPIYRSPMAYKLRTLSRSQISRGLLRNKGLEVAWTNDPVGLFYMQIQGSGILEYASGRRASLHFDGSNKKKFHSLSRFMKAKDLMRGNMGRERIQKWLYANPAYLNQALNSNPRYVFFKPANKNVRTASGLPIVPGHSVAVDTDYIPFGSVVLAEIPIINRKGQTLGTEWKILLPQDRGIAIKGPARMDIYTGTGEQARQIANQLTGHGRAYLLVSRSSTQLSQNNTHLTADHSTL